MIEWLMATLRQLFASSSHRQRMRTMAGAKEKGSFDGPSAQRRGSFEADYQAAIKLLRKRMNHKYPDNYHARLSSSGNSSYDYGEERAAAVDTVSTTVAMALRNGASVQQAAAAGAASVGI